MSKKQRRLRDTNLSSEQLYELGEYIASRPDLIDAGPRELEEALEKAGKVPPGDNFVTAFHAGLKAVGIRRRREEAAASLGRKN